MTLLLFHPKEELIGWMEGEDAPFPKHALIVKDGPFGGSEYTLARFDIRDGRQNLHVVNSLQPDLARKAVIEYYKKEVVGIDEDGG